MTARRPPVDTALPVPLKKTGAAGARGSRPTTPVAAWPGVEPVEPVVEDGDDDALDVAALGPALGPALADGDGEVVDIGGDSVDGGAALVRAQRIALPGQPGGDWVKDDVVAEPSDDELNRSVKSVGDRRDGIYSAFVRQATRVQRLSEHEERALGRRVRDFQDQEAAKKLVVHNLRLAIKMAYQYRRSWTNIMDLVQESSAGMAIAAQRWDPDQGTRFGTYAVYWIRAQLTKFLMTNGRAIHTGNTRAGRKLYFQLPRIRRKLLAEGKAATVDEIAAEVHETPEEVARIVARLDGREASLDAAVGDDEGGTLGDMLAGDDEGPEARVAANEVSRVIAELTRRFADTLEHDRDRAIWSEHLVSAEPKSLVELGERYGVSKQRMGQLATRIKRAFRRQIIDELGPHTQLHWLFASE
ncbi:MAG: sigma-70 family RNA polymerase sigma factor [Deltaproteobacteria bacterium]|nr:sigma-70 family RNA polymerase sigma factor [Deltaproteobacteria bacterium]